MHWVTIPYSERFFRFQGPVRLMKSFIIIPGKEVNIVNKRIYLITQPYRSEFFLSGSRQRRNWGAPGSLDCISSNIFSTLTMGGARRDCGFSSNTSNGGSMCYKNTRRPN